MHLLAFLGAALGVVGFCEGVALPEAKPAAALVARVDEPYSPYCRRDNKCLNRLFNDKPKAEYICKKLLHRPKIIYTTIYYPVKETKIFYNTEYKIVEVPIKKEVVKWLNPIINKRNAEIPDGAITADLQPAATTAAQPQATTDAELPLPTDTVSAQAIGDAEPAIIPDYPIFAGHDPSFRYCKTIDELKRACKCFLDYIHVPKIIVKKVYKKSESISVVCCVDRLNLYNIPEDNLMARTDIKNTEIIIVKKFKTITKVKKVPKIIPSPLIIKNAVSCFRTYKPLQPISSIDTKPIVVKDVKTAWDCCQLCAKTDNCIAASYGPATYFDLYLNGSPFGGEPATSTTCTYLVQTQKLLGAATTDNCPLGSRNIDFGPVNGYGSVFAGPCGY